MFYAEWCGHCQQYAKTYEKVAAALRSDVPGLLVAAINCPSHEKDCSSPAPATAAPRKKIQRSEACKEFYGAVGHLNKTGRVIFLICTIVHAFSLIVSPSPYVRPHSVCKTLVTWRDVREIKVL